MTGTVVDATTRQPLQAMVVEAWTPAGAHVASASTDGTGQYTLPSVPAGDYRLLAYDNAGIYATAFDGGAESFDTIPVIRLDAATQRVDFALVRGGRAAGRVTDLLDRGIAEVVVAAYNASGTLRGFTTTAGDGAWSLVLPPGSYRIATYDPRDPRATPLWATQFHPNARAFSEAAPVAISIGTPRTIDFRVERAARLSGQLRNAEGNPLPGPSVYAYTPEGALVGSTQTDVEGGWRLMLAPGPYRLVAADPGKVWATSYYPAGRSFERSPLVALAAGEVRPGIDFGLTRAASISGTIRGAGSALAAVEVGAFNPDGSLHVATRTGTDGTYSLAVAPGEIRIAAWDAAINWVTRFHPASADFLSSTPLAATPGGTFGAVDVELIRGGRVKGSLRDAITKLPIAGARIAAYDAAGVPAGDGRSTADGRYTFAAVPGDLRLVAFDPLMRYAAAYPASGTFDGGAPVTVTLGQDTAIDFELKRGVIVGGSIADPWGTLLNGIEVFALDEAGHRVAAATTVEGTFAIVLVPGRYHFVAIDPLRRFAPRHYPAASTFQTGSPVDIANGPNASLAMAFESGGGRRRAARH